MPDKRSQFVIIWVATLLFTVLRFSGMTNGPFKVAAHFFVGLLLGAYLVSRDRRYIIAFSFLTIAEVIAFILNRVL